MIQLADYQNQPGLDNQVMFGGQTTVEDLANINKALEAGDITGRETANLTTASGSPLKVESLEKTLKVITFGEKQIVLWKNVPKAPAFNTVEEYNQLTDYGQDRGGFNNEGELPNEEDSTYVRRAQLVKFLGVVKSVTHPMTLVNTMIGSAIEREAKNGTLWILRKLSKALYTGDSSLIPQEFNGFLTQHAQNDSFATLNDYMNSSVVIDLRGAPLSEAPIETAANSIVENFGLGTEIYAPPRVLSDFVKNFYGNKFIQPNTEALTNGIMGQKVKSFESQFGNIGLNPDIFFNKPASKSYGAAATSSQAPSPIIPDAVTPVNVVGATVANTKWASTDAGNYYYAITAVNRYGESALVSMSGAAAAAVLGCAIDLKFAAGASTVAATAFIIYRSDKNAVSAATATYYPIFTVSIANLGTGYDGGAASVVRDLNRYMTNCNQAVLFQQDNEVMEFKQLAPLMKMDLAIVSPAYRFMVLLYGTPFLYAPLKMVRFINIGLAS